MGFMIIAIELSAPTQSSVRYEPPCGAEICVDLGVIHTCSGTHEGTCPIMLIFGNLQLSISSNSK